MANTKNQLVVYVKRNSLHLVGAHLQEPLVWDIPLSLLADLEILNPPGFEDMIKARLLEQKFTPAPVALILSPEIYYEKDIDPMQPTQNFLDAVPFEHLASATFSIEKKSKIVATNQDLIESISHAFDSTGFTTEAIVPVFLLKQFGVDLTHGLDHNNGIVILKNFETLKTYSLFSHHEVFSQPTDITPNTAPRKSNRTRVIALTAVFLLLISVLVFLLVQNGKNNSPGLQKSTSKNTP